MPAETYAPNVSLAERQYITKIQVFVPGGMPVDLPDITSPREILGFDRGRKKPADASNGEEIRYDPSADVAERKADYHHVRTKKKGGKRRQHAQAARRSHKRIQRCCATKRHQVKNIIVHAQPKAVAVESLRLPNSWPQPLAPQNILASMSPPSAP